MNEVYIYRDTQLIKTPGTQLGVYPQRRLSQAAVTHQRHSKCLCCLDVVEHAFHIIWRIGEHGVMFVKKAN